MERNLNERRISKAIERYRKVRLTIELRRITREILAERETFTDVIDRLRLPLTPKF